MGHWSWLIIITFYSWVQNMLTDYPLVVEIPLLFYSIDYYICVISWTSAYVAKRNCIFL